MDQVDVPDRGSVRFINNSQNDLYDIYLENTKMGNVYGNDTVIIRNVVIGKRQAKAIQASNIVDNKPQFRQETVIVYKDSVTTFQFP